MACIGCFRPRPGGTADAFGASFIRSSEGEREHMLHRNPGKRKNLNRAFAAALLCLLAVFLSGCGPSPARTDEKLTFRRAASPDALGDLDGKRVSVNGYMAASSPADGSCIFLMNLPAQPGPFCRPNSSRLSNTMAVYPKAGKRFDSTPRAVKVVGTLQAADPEAQPFSDQYGHTFRFKITDAEYTIIRESELIENIALWQELADSGVIREIYAMYEYLDFVTRWPAYFVSGGADENAADAPGHYLYPDEALDYLRPDGARWNYGYRAGYFDGLVKAIEKVDWIIFSGLVKNVRGAEALANRAIQDLLTGNYTYELKYVERSGREDYLYTLNRGEELARENDALFDEFEDWLAAWEM